MKNILFVCTGNTCRSPMADGLFENMIENNKDNYSNISHTSAGIYVFGGERPTDEAIKVMAEEGIDISQYRSKGLTEKMVEDADVVFVMTKNHKNYMRNSYPSASEKIFTLKEYAYGKEDDIIDPFGEGMEVYRKVKEDIKDALEEILQKMRG
ncbi:MULTISPECIES: low molecular weight protein arginine phosphatase [Tissierellales]|nr:MULTISPECIES: low molecular weight protein arginine phosphatase [Tissierellales]